MGMFLRRGPAPHRTRMSDLEIEQMIKLNLNGTPWEWLVVHQGLPSSLYDESCNGTWLLLKNIYETRVWNSTDSNILETSTIQSYLNGDFLGLFDPRVQSAIKQVKIPYRSGGGSGGTNQSGVNGLLCKVFLLAGYEVGWTTSNNSYFPIDGACLSYFSGTKPTDTKRCGYLNGSVTSWWLRSPYSINTSNVFYVRTDGSTYRSGHKTSTPYGIRPAIILPSDMLVTDDMLAA